MKSKLDLIIRILAICVFLVSVSVVYIFISERNGSISQAQKIQEKGSFIVFDESENLAGYVDVESATFNYNTGTIDITGTLNVYVLNSCDSFLMYEWPNLTVACLNGQTTKRRIVGEYYNLRILTDNIQAIKK